MPMFCGATAVPATGRVLPIKKEVGIGAARNDPNYSMDQEMNEADTELRGWDYAPFVLILILGALVVAKIS